MPESLAMAEWLASGAAAASFIGAVLAVVVPLVAFRWTWRAVRASMV